MKKARHLNDDRRRARLAESLPPEAASASESVQVWISHLDPGAETYGLDRERLQAEMEMRLARDGIPPAGAQRPASGPRFPCLGVIIHLNRGVGPRLSYVFSLEVFFVHFRAAVGLRTSSGLEMTWCKEAIGDVRETGPGLDWNSLYLALGHLVDEFVQDYLMVNPHSLPTRIIN